MKEEIKNIPEALKLVARTAAQEIHKREPLCRDCADNHGRCPNRGNRPCDPVEDTTEIILDILTQMSGATELANKEPRIPVLSLPDLFAATAGMKRSYASYEEAYVNAFITRLQVATYKAKTVEDVDAAVTKIQEEIIGKYRHLLRHTDSVPMKVWDAVAVIKLRIIQTQKFPVPEGYAVVMDGTTFSGDLVWNCDEKKFQPVDAVNAYVQDYICVARKS